MPEPLPLLLRAGRALPPALAWAVGGALGRLAAHLPTREARRCRAHLARAFPERDAAWVRRTAERTWRHFGRLALWTLAHADRDPRRLRRGVAVEDRATLRELVGACRAGDGTLCFTGHLGNWELIPRIMGGLLPLTVIGRRLRWPAADRAVRALREQGGARQADRDDDVRALIRELRQGRVVATLADQDLPKLAGDWVPWFGHPAYTPTAPAMLAQLAGGWAVCGFMFWHRGRWVMHISHRRRFPRGGDREATLRAITAWAMAYEEALVRRHPEQWVWWHLRWRTQRPPAAASVGAECGGAQSAPSAECGVRGRT